MPIKGILFDFGGVIMRTEDRKPRLELAQKQGVSIEDLERLVFSSQTAKKAEVGSISAYQHWQAVAQAICSPEEKIPAIREQFFAGDRIDWEVLKNIRERRAYYHTALLSNAFDDLRAELTGDSPPPSAYHISKTDHLLEFFDEVIISAEVGFAKPDSPIYQLAADRLGLPVSECVFIDDFPPNVEGARSAGMHAIRFLNPEQACEELNILLYNNHSAE